MHSHTLTQQWNIGNAYHQTLCSYGYALMAIHFLQRKRQDIHPILPILTSQSWSADAVLADTTDTQSIRRQLDPSLITPHNNTESLSELFVYFLLYQFQYFDWQSRGQSIITATGSTPRPSLKRSPNAAMFLLDPIDRNRNIGVSVSPSGFELMRATAIHSLRLMRTTGVVKL